MPNLQAWVIGTPENFNICKSSKRPYNALCESPEGTTDPDVITLTEDNGVYTAAIDATLQSNKSNQVSASQAQLRWDELRRDRNARLTQCDWTQTSDAPLSKQKKAEWQEYRHALRMLPQNTVDPESPEWPEEPS